MLNIEDLIAALNDPNSPMREKLLQHLEQSPLDPVQSAQKLIQESGVEQGGLPPEPPEQKGSMAGMLGTAEPATMEPFLPLPNIDRSSQAQGPVPGLQAPNPAGIMPRADMSREANPLETVDLANSAQALPGQPLMPSGDPTALLKMFQSMYANGSAMGVGDEGQNFPQAQAVAPRGNNWNTFSATQLQTPGVARQPTLAELLEGRGR